MDEFDSFETLALSMFDPDDLSTSFGGSWPNSAFNSSDLDGIPVDAERAAYDTYGYCVIA